MKKYLLILFLLCSVTCFGQKVGESSINHDTTLIKAPTNKLGVDTTNRISTYYRLYKSIDSLAAISGSSRSVDTLWRTAGTDSIYFKINGIQYAILDSAGGLSPPEVDTIYRTLGKDSIQFTIAGRYHAILDSLGTTDTTSLSNRINLKLSISDTAAMLSPYLLAEDTTGHWQPSGSYITPSDTASMLSPYFHTVDTANKWVAKRDSSNGGYYPYTSNPKGYSTTTGTVTSVATGYGLSGGTIVAAGTLIVDSTKIATPHSIHDSLSRFTPTTSLGSMAYSDSVLFHGNANIVTVGALSSGSIASGFTSIDTARTNAVSYLDAGTNTSVSVSGGKRLKVNVVNNGSQFYADSTIRRDTVYSNCVSAIAAGTNISVSQGGKKVTISLANNGSMFYADSVLFHGNTNITTVGTVVTGAWHVTPAIGDTAYGFTGANTTLGARKNLGLQTCIDLYDQLGATWVGESAGATFDAITVSASIVSGSVFYQLLTPPPAGTVVTALDLYQSVLGSYTNPITGKNRVGLATYSAGTFTIVDSSADNSALWKTSASNTMVSTQFATSYTILANTTYYGVMIYNNSAVVTNPSFGFATGRVSANVASTAYTNSAKTTCFLSGQTDFTHSQAASGTTATGSRFWMALK